jgi:hypothetical protein
MKILRFCKKIPASRNCSIPNANHPATKIRAMAVSAS